MVDRKLPWQRIVGEMTVIVVSVFVAIALESAWQERQKAGEAKQALAQVLIEIRQDRVILDDVLVRQQAIDAIYVRLLEWLGDPQSIPAEQFTATLDDLVYDNQTLFARRSAWTMMVESSYLPLLDAPALVNRLGSFYEDETARLDFNNENYDDELFTILRETGSTVWDFTNMKLRTSDPTEIGRFRDQLRYLHRTWNLWYVDFMRDYGRSADALIADIERYLQSD